MNYGKGDVAANTSEAIYDNDLELASETHYNARKYFTNRIGVLNRLFNVIIGSKSLS